MPESSTVTQNDLSSSAEGTQSLWARLAEAPGENLTLDELVRTYSYIVKEECTRARYRFPRHIDPEELEVTGLEALFFAIRDFNPNLGSFEGYARRRVWGGIVDRVRRLDGTPRMAFQASKILASATACFKQRHGRAPGQEELADEAGVTLEHLERLERHSRVSTKLSLDMVDSSNGEGGTAADSLTYSRSMEVNHNPLHKMADDETKAMLVEGLKALPERERGIMVLYYHEGIMFTEIAEAMGVSESRVSQMHSRALERLKHYLTCPAARNKGQLASD